MIFINLYYRVAKPSVLRNLYSTALNFSTLCHCATGKKLTILNLGVLLQLIISKKDRETDKLH